MPADRDLALPAGAPRHDLARRLGVAGFWRWWTRMLASLVPAGPRTALERRRMRPVLAFEGERATLWLPHIQNGRIELREHGHVGLTGDAAAVAAEGRNALAALARTQSPLRVAVALAPRAILRKSLVLPAAIEPDLRQALAYDLDRHTPFKPEELYFDAHVVDRDVAREQIRVDLAAVRRAQVDPALAHAQAWGAKVVAIRPESPPALPASELNLLPPEMRNGARFARRWQFWLPIGLLAAVAIVAAVLPVWQKREYAIALNDVAGQAMREAAVSDSLRTQLERQVGDYNFALERKYGYPATVRVLDDVTRILPDDTWLTQLEIKTTSRGKDAQREVALRGESANAGRLVTLLEDSRLFAQAAPRSPTTKIQPGPGEIFDVGAQLKPLPPPTAVSLLASDPTAGVPAPVSPATTSATAPAAPEAAAPPPPAAPQASAAPPADGGAITPPAAPATAAPAPLVPPPAAPPAAPPLTPAPAPATSAAPPPPSPPVAATQDSVRMATPPPGQARQPRRERATPPQAPTPGEPIFKNWSNPK